MRRGAVLFFFSLLAGFISTGFADAQDEDVKETIQDLKKRLEDLEREVKNRPAATDAPDNIHFSGDLLLHAFTEKNALFSKSSSDWIETVARLQATADLDGGHQAVVRITHTSTGGNDANSYPTLPVEGDTFLADKAHVIFKNIGGEPIDVKFGRQEVILGTGFIIGDGYTDTVAEFNGSIQYFDGLRVSYTPSEEFSGDMYWLRINSNRVQFAQNLTLQTGGGELYGIEARYENDEVGKWATGYAQREDKSAFENDTMALYLRGARSIPWIKGLNFNFEAVKQGGNTLMREGIIDTSGVDHRHSRDAFGGYVDLVKNFDVPSKLWVRGRYVFFTGDKKGTTKNEAFEPMFYDWDTWGHSVLDNSNAGIEKYTVGGNFNETTTFEATWYNYYFHRRSFNSSSKHYAEGHSFVVKRVLSKNVFIGGTYALLDPSQAALLILPEDKSVTQASFFVFTFF